MTNEQATQTSASGMRGGQRALPPVRLAELTDDLLWPRLLRAAGQAARPERIGLAAFMLVLIALVLKLPDAWTPAGQDGLLAFASRLVSDAWADLAEAVRAVSVMGFVAGLYELTIQMPLAVVGAYPVSTAAVLVPLIVIWGIGGTALSRMVATDASQGVSTSWPQGLAMGVHKGPSSVAALVIPLLVVAAITAGLAAGGWLFLRWPVADVIGAVLFGGFVIAGAIGVLVIVCFVLGGHLLIPAVTCDGADAIDAVQRAYSYVSGRPMRLIAHAAVVIALGVVAIGLAALFAEWTIGLTRAGATLVGGPRAAAILGVSGAANEGSAAWAARIINVWLFIPVLLAAGYAVSYYFAASTLVYLTVRAVNDGQDVGELWHPGMIENTMAQAMQSRAKASAHLVQGRAGGELREDGEA